MKKIFTLLLTSLALVSFAQTVNYAFVAVGGRFGDDSDNARLVAFDLENPSELIELDTIIANSVQDIEVVTDASEGGSIFLASQDSVTAYDLFTPTSFEANVREQLYFPRVGKLDAVEDVLFVGRSYGEGDYLVAYDKLDLTNELYVSPNIKTTYKDLLQLNDSLVAISYIIKTTANECTWNCEDSLGVIDVINVNSWDVETINLGSEKVGSLTMLKPSGDNGFLLSASSNSSITYISEDFIPLIDTLNTTISGFLIDEIDPTDNSTIVKTTSGNVSEAFINILPTGITFSENILTATSGKNVANEDNDGVVFGLNTDYATYGEVIVHNSGVENDTVQVGISVEDVEVGSFIISGLNDVFTSDEHASDTYFSTDLALIEFTDFTLINSNGSVFGQFEALREVNFNTLSSGVYILKNVEGETLRVIKE